MSNANTTKQAESVLLYKRSLLQLNKNTTKHLLIICFYRGIPGVTAF